MDSASLRSLTPILDGIDRWVELAPLLPVIISLELVLSADNAIALASITKNLKNLDEQKLALDFGILLSLFFRIIVIFMAQLFLKFWPLKLFASFYLLALFFNKIFENKKESDMVNLQHTSEVKKLSLIKIILILAFTDLAFSIDSVAAAVAISDQILLVLTGAVIGVIALRFTSGLFIKFLDEYLRLEIAGYIAVGLVGLKLLILLIVPSLVIPEWFVFTLMIGLFIWGFSKRDMPNVSKN